MTKAVLFSAVFFSAIGFAAPVKTVATTPSKDGGSAKLEAPSARPDASRAKSPAAITVGDAPATTVATTAAPTGSRIHGMVETRPSYYYSNNGRWGTENTAELGWMPNSDRLFSYTQYFNTNLYNPNKPGAGAGLTVLDGFFRYKMKNIWNSEDRTWSLTYDPRIYLPTDPTLRANGLYGYTRQYLTLSKKLSSTMTLSFIEIPFLYGYDRAGYQTGGKDFANPIFENREYIVFDVSLFNGFADFSFPLLINHQRARKFGTAANSDRWSHVVWTWPELDFNVAPHTVVGISWESDNFIKDDFSAVDISHGLENGLAQLVLRATL